MNPRSGKLNGPITIEDIRVCCLLGKHLFSGLSPVATELSLIFSLFLSVVLSLFSSCLLYFLWSSNKDPKRINLLFLKITSLGACLYCFFCVGCFFFFCLPFLKIIMFNVVLFWLLFVLFCYSFPSFLRWFLSPLVFCFYFLWIQFLLCSKFWA